MLNRYLLTCPEEKSTFPKKKSAWKLKGIFPLNMFSIFLWRSNQKCLIGGNSQEMWKWCCKCSQCEFYNDFLLFFSASQRSWKPICSLSDPISVKRGRRRARLPWGGMSDTMTVLFVSFCLSATKAWPAEYSLPLLLVRMRRAAGQRSEMVELALSCCISACLQQTNAPFPPGQYGTERNG